MGDELRLLLSRKPFLKQLIVYLETSSSEENALCYESIQSFKDDFAGCDPQDAENVSHPMTYSARALWRRYLAPSAPMKVNLTARSLKPIDHIFMVCVFHP